jgi:DNA-binding NarL/FixJ family response regulator
MLIVEPSDSRLYHYFSKAIKVEIMNDAITVLIADDHPIFRKGLRQIIEVDSGIQIVAEVADGEAALVTLRELKPKIAILDIDMPKKDGFELARIIREEQLSVAVVFLTMYKEERFFNAALDAGVQGYVLKDSAINEIVNCIRAVATGENFISPTLSTYLINRGRRASRLSEQQPGLQSLTSAEKRVLKLIAEYQSNKQIAEKLFISVRTVEHHRANIAAKLGIKGTLALLEFALKHQSDW